MPRTLAKWLLLIALLAYAALMAAYASSTLRARRCTGLEVQVLPPASGAPSFLTPKAVERELGDLPQRITSYPISALNTEALEQRLQRVNNFEHVECYITGAGRLVVSVLPLVPEARIFTPAGTYYINREGKRLDAHAEYWVDLPVVQGAFTRRMPATGALPVARAVQRDSLLRSLVTMIHYRDPHNIILVPRIRGHVINLGDTTRLDEKISALKLFYSKVIPLKGWAEYDTISVKFRGQVVASRRIKSARDHSTHFADPDPDPEEATAVDQTRATAEDIPTQSPPQP